MNVSVVSSARLMLMYCGVKVVSGVSVVRKGPVKIQLQSICHSCIGFNKLPYVLNSLSVFWLFAKKIEIVSDKT